MKIKEFKERVRNAQEKGYQFFDMSVKNGLGVVAEIQSLEEEIESLQNVINAISKDTPTPNDVKEAYFKGVDEGRPR